MNPKEILAMIKDQDAKIVDFKFQDFPGTWQHFSVPSRELTEESFEDGFGFDGSSIRGWQAIKDPSVVSWSPEDGQPTPCHCGGR